MPKKGSKSTGNPVAESAETSAAVQHEPITVGIDYFRDMEVLCLAGPEGGDDEDNMIISGFSGFGKVRDADGNVVMRDATHPQMAQYPGAQDTRTQYGYSLKDKPKYNNLIAFANNNMLGISDIEIMDRNGIDGKLISFNLAADKQQHNMLVDYSTEPYTVKFDGALPTCDCLGEGSEPVDLNKVCPMIALAAKMGDSNPEFKAAFEKMIAPNSTKDFEEFRQITATACDAFKIETENLEMAKDIEFNVTFDELTKEMVDRFRETGEFGSSKPTVEYDVENGVFNLEAALAGAYRIDHDWSDDAKQHIPSLSLLEEYIPIDDFQVVFHAIDKQLKAADEIGESPVNKVKYFKNIMFQGEPGTGKTMTVQALAATFGIPVWSVTMSKNAEEDMIWGTTRVNGDKIEFDEGDILRGFREGGIVFIDEINLAPPGVTQGALSQATSAPYIIRKGGTGDIVERSPNTVIMSARNINLDGTQKMNDALLSRFPLKINVKSPEPEKFIETIVKQKGVTESTARYVYNAYNTIREAVRSEGFEEEASTKLTLRDCMEAAELVNDASYGVDKKNAIRLTMLQSFADVDTELPDKLFKSIDVLTD